MAATTAEFPRRDHIAGVPVTSAGMDRGDTSAVSWEAIAAGAAAAAALSLGLLILGLGLGMTIISPWSPGSFGAAEVGVSSIIWLAVSSLLASALGGYLAGRLRRRWTDVQRDEVYFRDTAHGFLTWSVATLATATLMASMVTSIVSGGAQTTSAMVGAMTTVAAAGTGAAVTNADESPMDYFIDALFRRDNRAAVPGGWPEDSSTAGTVAEDAQEVRRIFTHMVNSAALPTEDVRHLGQLITRRSGLTQQAAEARVNDIYGRAQGALQEMEMRVMDAAEKARQATAYGSLWLFLALLGGAFAASLAATYGGRQRDS